jgi:hypothetical protein
MSYAAQVVNDAIPEQRPGCTTIPAGGGLTAGRAIAEWEGEGGAPGGSEDSDQPPAPSSLSSSMLIGSEAQVEWAERIKSQIDAEFDRVIAAFRSVAARQSGDKRADTEAIIAIAEAVRIEVLENKQAGYFIRDWQEMRDQVRQLIFDDPRFQAIKSGRLARQGSLE